jgi:hypothetical protein
MRVVTGNLADPVAANGSSEAVNAKSAPLIRLFTKRMLLLYRARSQRDYPF